MKSLQGHSKYRSQINFEVLNALPPPVRESPQIPLGS
jgi:hypothetical protein